MLGEDKGRLRKSLARALLAISFVLCCGSLVIFVVVLAPWSLVLLGITLLVVTCAAVSATRK